MQDKKSSTKRRVNTVYGVVFLSFTSLILRLGYSQIASGADFRKQETTMMVSRVPVLPARGWIYDANGQLIAYDQPAYSVYLTRLPQFHGHYEALAQKLAPVFSISESALLKIMLSNQFMAQVRIWKNATNGQLSYIEEHVDQLPGITVMAEPQRVYPYGDLAGQVLGYTGAITAQNYAYYSKLGYLGNQEIGETGLENQYESKLQGQVGYQVVEVNSQGTPLKTLGYSPVPVQGQNLHLTLDGHLQAVAQNALMAAITKNQNSADISDAEAVVLDVKTGGVLSMVSYPYLDPNWFVSGKVGQHANYLINSSAQVNHTIQSPRYPGSTVKPANLITGLNHGAILPSTQMYGYSAIRVGSALLHNDGQDNGVINAVQAIAESSDTFFYEVGLYLGKWFGSNGSSGGGYSGTKDYQTWLNTSFAKGLTTLYQGEWNFGLGQLTGVDLPGESKGYFYIEDANQRYIRVSLPLSQAEASIQKTGSFVNHGTPVDLAFAGIGQSQEFTTMQLAQYAATIANNGKRLQPHLIQLKHPVVQNIVQTKPEYLQMAQQGMHDVVNAPYGTAYGIFNGAPYTAAGKTGTAQIVSNNKAVDNSVFICYAPFDHPQVALAIMVPGGGYGAGTAAPVARQILDTYFAEHHEFFPKNKWQDSKIPSNWLQSPAYQVPENSH